MNLKRFIIEKAQELNIEKIGFVDSSPLLEIEEYLKDRKERGLQTEFEENEIKKRIDPKLTLPNCKSIIVIALSYNVKNTIKNDKDLSGVLSKSSWGIDYHKVLKDKMDKLIKEIQRVEDFEYKCYVDTGPLIERELANKAGIGYYGKNCSIINDEYGSYIFIGYIMTDLEIAVEDNKLSSECGECDLCIKACPTNALGPYKLNPKKCIAYLSQTKDIIPLEYRSKMGTKIYGCDTCQLVCPKNKGVKFSNHEEFVPLITNGYINILELLNMSNKEFKNKYGSMAGSWRGKNVLKRNAIIAIGNMKMEENIFLLKEILLEENSEISNYARWAMKNIFLTKE